MQTFFSVLSSETAWQTSSLSNKRFWAQNWFTWSDFMMTCFHTAISTFQNETGVECLSDSLLFHQISTNPKKTWLAQKQRNPNSKFVEVTGTRKNKPEQPFRFLWNLKLQNVENWAPLWHFKPVFEALAGVFSSRDLFFRKVQVSIVRSYVFYNLSSNIGQDPPPHDEFVYL